MIAGPAMLDVPVNWYGRSPGCCEPSDARAVPARARGRSRAGSRLCWSWRGSATRAIFRWSGRHSGCLGPPRTVTATRSSTCSPPRHQTYTRPWPGWPSRAGRTWSSTARCSAPTAPRRPPPASWAPRSTPGTRASTTALAATCKRSCAPMVSLSGPQTSLPATTTTCPPPTRSGCSGRCTGLPRQLGLPSLADSGYSGTGHGVHTP